MRILLAADTYYPHVNGASYFAQRLAQALHQKNHTVAVVAPSQSFANTKTYIDDILVYGIRSIPVFFYRDFRFSAFAADATFQNILTEFQPDIVHLQAHFYVNRKVFKASRKNNLPIVATNHFMPENLVHYLPVPEFMRNIVKNWAWRDFASIYNQVGRITTPTETAADLIRDKVKLPVEAISCGIDLQKFDRSQPTADLRERYALPNQPILLYVGRLDREKNLDTVLRAVALARQQTQFHFVIAGTGAERQRLEKLARELKIAEHVTFAGFVPNADLPALYLLASCFIIAGIAELQSIVTMEALAAGLPVLGVNAMALPELVHDGENGFLFELADISGLSAKITKILADPDLQKKFGSASLDIIAKHDITTTIAAFEQLYHEQIARAQSGAKSN